MARTAVIFVYLFLTIPLTRTTAVTRTLMQRLRRGSVLEPHNDPVICFAQSGVRSIAPDRTYDKTLEDQLKVISALQVEKQIDSVKERKEKDIGENRGDALIATGIVALPPPSGKGIDVSQYPLGYVKANMLENSFESDDSALIITAVPINGPPFAAKIVRDLKKQDFPYPFSLRTSDLIFPYTASAWKSSPMSRKSISLTAILDPDGKLATPMTLILGSQLLLSTIHLEAAKMWQRLPWTLTRGSARGHHLGAMRSPVHLCQRAFQVPSSGNFALSARKMEKETKEALLPRRGARISISLKADASPYNDRELELLERIDSFLASR